MGMTMTQKILAAHAGLPEVGAGQLIEAKLDLCLGNDITAPVAINEFERCGACRVYDKSRVALVMDHFTPNKDIKAAEQVKKTREFAGKMGVEHFYDVGRMGIEHALLPEQGLVGPGDCVIGADSHTCTYGALGAFSTGVGSTDLAAGMATGKAWFKVPSAIQVVLTGRLGRFVSGKDVILHLIGEIGVDGALYGAKNGVFPVDDVTMAYVEGRFKRTPVVYEADDDAVYDQVVTIDLSALRPTVSFPHLPENTKTIDECRTAGENGGPVRIDQVVIGSCTNGRIEDMRAAAEILKGRKVADGVRCIIIPATQEIWRQSMHEGLFDVFVEAGAVVSTPTCGPCLGGHMGILAAGERAVSTTNRNFVGRMGHVDSEVYLASPYVAAASAVAGVIADPASL